MPKVFLDVGAHLGETLEAVREPRWGFDRIYCFEPAEVCWPAIEAVAAEDDRVELCRFGLWLRDDRVALHDPGEIGASMIEAKALSDSHAQIEVRDAARWFAAHLGEDDTVVAKINCEGAECDILDRLIEGGQIHQLDELVVHWDVRKIAGQAHREAATKARLDALGVPYRDAETILFGGNTLEKTRNWLGHWHAGPMGKLRHRWLHYVTFRVRVAVYDLRHRR